MSALKMVGDSELVQLLQQQEINTRAAALEYETSHGDNYHNSYQHSAALPR